MKTKTLTVDQETFVDWYYSDQSSSALRNIAWDLISTVRDTGEFRVTAQYLFENAGYLPIGLINFEEDYELEAKFREAYTLEGDEIESFGDIVVDGIKYDLVLDNGDVPNEGDIKVKVDFEYDSVEFTIIGYITKEDFDKQNGYGVGYVEGGDMMTDAEGMDVYKVIEGQEELEAYYLINDGSSGSCDYEIIK